MCGAHDLWRGGGRHCGEQLRPPPAAELVGHAAGDEGAGATGQRRQDSKADGRRAEEVIRGPRHRRDEWRLVDVAPRKMARAGEEVELVSMDAVAGGDRQFEGDEGSGDDEKGSEGEPGQARCVFSRPASLPHPRKHSASFGRKYVPWHPRRVALVNSLPQRVEGGGDRILAPHGDAAVAVAR